MKQLKFQRADFDEAAQVTIDSLAEDFDGLKSETADQFIFTFEREQDVESFKENLGKKLSEFSLNFAQVQDKPAELSPAEIPAEVHDDYEVSDLPPVQAATPAANVMVSVDSASVTSYDSSSPDVMIDVVLSVSKSGETYETFKVVKRIKMDRQKLIDQAMQSQAQVVEKEATDDWEDRYLAKMKANAGVA